jgi:predicted phosphoribosyltransferase
MSMGNDHSLSAEDKAAVVSTFIDLAEIQQDNVEKLLDQAKTVLNALDRGITDMPNKIAHAVVQRIADLVTQKVADVLQPAEAKAQTLLKAMEEEVAECRRAAVEYRRAAAECRREARNVVLTCIIAAAVSAVLVVLAIWWFSL